MGTSKASSKSAAQPTPSLVASRLAQVEAARVQYEEAQRLLSEAQDSTTLSEPDEPVEEAPVEVKKVVAVVAGKNGSGKKAAVKKGEKKDA